MKRTFHNTISVLMALTVLLSTSSFTVDKHFCGGLLMDMAVYSEAKSCVMGIHDHSDRGTSINKDHCCSNEKILVEGQDELKNSFLSLDLEQQVFLGALANSYVALFNGIPRQVPAYKFYSPPLLIHNIYLRDQVFLI
ncbi:HYC_CC_PP family protein [Salegentibacter sp. HM20]